MSALIEHNLEQQTEEWLTLRRSKIGASDAPVILELSPWKTPYELWMEKMSGNSNTIKTAAMQRGIDLEGECRLNFALEKGISVDPIIVTHKDKPWMMASLDGISRDRKTLVEIKCPGEYDHRSALAGKVPEKYFPQLQHQLEICELDEMYYYSFDGENGVMIKVHRDDKFIKGMIEKELAFWECMQNFKAPKFIDRDVNIRGDDVWIEVARRYAALDARLSVLEKEKDSLRDTLITMTGDRNSEGGGVKVSRVIRKGNVDYSKIPELKGVDLEEYRKEAIETWRISV